MKLKAFLITTALLLIYNDAFCCLAASQNRLFPVGKSSQGFMFLETKLSRFGSEIHEKWRGTAYLAVYNKKRESLHKQLIGNVEFSTDLYTQQVQLLFKKAQKLAQVSPGFIEAKPIQITFCGYNRNCSMATLHSSDTKNQFSIQLASGTKKYNISILDNESSIAGEFIEKYKSYSLENLSKVVLINSVRRMVVGNEHLTLLHLGNGQTFTSAVTGEPFESKEYKPNFSFSTLEESTFYEPVMHHGMGFDLFIVE
ncbi:MAG: hypothetical protein ABFR97_05520 [Thermodesulfobacteriota bacterium]